MGRRELLGVVLCLAVSFLGTAAFRIQFPAVSFYSKNVLRASFLEIGLFTSSFMAARAIASLIASKLYRSPAISRALPPTGFAANALLAYLYTLVSSPTQILALRAAQGLLNGLSWVTIQVVLGELAPPNLRATLYTLYFSIGSLGIVTANAIYARLARLYTRPYYAAMHISLALFVTASALSLALPYRAHRVGEERTKFARRFSLAMILLPSSISIAMSLPSSDVIYVYVSESMNMARSTVAELMALAMLCATLLGLALSFVADRVSVPLALCTLSAITIASCIAMPVTNPLIFAAALILLVSTSRSFRSILRKIAISRLGPEGIGIVNASGNLGMVAGSAIVGWLYDALDNNSLCIARGLCLNDALSLVYASMAVSIAASTAILIESSTRSRRPS